MKAFYLFILLFLQQVVYPHSPDLASAMIYEQQGKTFIAIKSSLTAFEGEINYLFNKNAYKTPEEFQNLVIEHFQKNCFVVINNQTKELQNPHVILGHETIIFAELQNMPNKISTIHLKIQLFRDMPNNQCEFIFLWKDLPQYQCVLSNLNNQEVKLRLKHNKWLVQEEINNSFYDYFKSFCHFVAEGFRHVLPLGLDHILFIMALFFLKSNLKSSIIQASMFTLAHSITLILTGLGYFVPNPVIIEPLIAISIFAIALQNIFYPKINHSRLAMLFVFGLIHGLGFASAFLSLQIPTKFTLNALFAFNIGVELAQILIILLLYYLLAKWAYHTNWYQQYFVKTVSIAIGIIALLFTFQRL